MATTTNYGWTTPDNTDLVKDGALAIRTLGSAIDTSMNTALGTKKAGMVLLNTTSFSAVSSQSINDVFSATYTNYRIVISNLTQSASVNGVYFRLRVSGSDQASGYYNTTVYNAGSGFINSNQTNGTFMGFASIADTTNASFTTIDLGSPFATASTTNLITLNTNLGAGLPTLQFTAGVYPPTTSFTGFSLVAAAGTTTGTVSVYGYNK